MIKPITDNRNQKTIPQHVAFIMDGNRRWAREKGFFPLKGHQIGEDRIEPIIDKAIELGIPYLTFWAFSTENWQREKKEVEFLLNMFRQDLAKRVDSFHQKNVKIRVIGNIQMFPQDIQQNVNDWMEKTKNNKLITVNIALSYGGRDEIMRAVEKWRAGLKFNSAKAKQNSKLKKEDIEQYLDTFGQPDPNLIIRTGGEQRLSGFLLWQSEYSELYFIKTLWPDFTPQKFEEALSEFQKRQRRFGK